MPNHITNRIIVNGSEENVKRFFEAIGSVQEDGTLIPIDFNKIKPMPESLNIEAGSNTEIGYILYYLSTKGVDHVSIEQWAYKSLERRLSAEKCDFSDDGIKRFILSEEGQVLYRLGKAVQENMSKYGARTWYDWCNREWGTKWNAYNQERINENTITFQTAWCGVPKILHEIAQSHPDVELSYLYADEDWGNNVGSFTFHGADVDANLPTGGSDEARAIAEELLGPCWYEDEDEFEDEMEI